jgi:hypothetical protein
LVRESVERSADCYRRWTDSAADRCKSPRKLSPIKTNNIGAQVQLEPVLARVDPILATPINLTDEEFSQLVDFVRNGLLDRRAKPENLRKMIPMRMQDRKGDSTN